MSKRTNNIIAVTLVQYATMYVEADTPAEAVLIAKEHKEEYLDDDDFDGSKVDVFAVESFTSEVEVYMKKIWADDGIKSNRQYLKELKEQED